MEKKLDFRVQRTYQTLQNALFELMSEKNFDDITVGELCERAMIRRATFYKHFGDKYELFAFSIRELQEQFEEKNKPEPDAGNPRSFYVGMIDHSLQFVEQNGSLMRALMQSRHSQLLFDILSNEIEFDIRMHLREDTKGGAVLPAKPELLAAMITGSLIYTMKWWVAQETEVPRGELVQIFMSLFQIM